VLNTSSRLEYMLIATSLLNTLALSNTARPNQRSQRSQPLEMHRLITHVLIHQILKRPIRVHQLRRWAHKSIRHLPHTTKQGMLKHPIGAIHPIDQLHREAQHLIVVARDGRKLREDHRRVRVPVMHRLQISDGGIAISAVVMEAEKVGRAVSDQRHEGVDPRLAGRIRGARRADELLALGLTQGKHLALPDVGGALRGNARTFGLVEKVDNTFVGGFDALPVVAAELGFEPDHGPEGGARFQLGGRPRVPVADGVEGPGEVDAVHGPGDALVAGTVGVGPVPEEGALFDGHVEGGRAAVMDQAWWRDRGNEEERGVE